MRVDIRAVMSQLNDPDARPGSESTVLFVTMTVDRDYIIRNEQS